LVLPRASPGRRHRAAQPLPAAPGERMTAARAFAVVGLVAFALVVLVPFWWIANMSFKTYEQVQFATSIYVPRPFTWANYTALWLDTRFPLWLRNSLVTAVPRGLVEAAVVDGAGRTAALVRVLLPLAAPGIVASAIFAFTLSWNEFLYALVFIQDETALTVPVGLNLLIYGDVFSWGQLMAASVITTVPVVALYVFIQRWMVEGLAAGSVKG